MADIRTFPAFCDVHVHFREPGAACKETIATGSAAALAGGYADVCTMPNVTPVPDSVEHLREQTDLIERDAAVRIYPYGAITVGEAGERLADLEALAPLVMAFSDDGHGVQSASVMEEAMRRCAQLGKVIAAHCEDESLVRGGYINDGPYAHAHGHAGICAESEWGPIARDADLAAKTGCAYHVCHVSTARSVEVIRQAKASGVDITCETAPHYLLLDERSLREDGRFKMNPPLRLPEDREALIEGICDGTVDMIATDHAPHTSAEKARGLVESPFGIVGLETAFPLLHEYLVRPGVITLERLIELLAYAPRRRFGISDFGATCTWDMDCLHEIVPDEFKTMGRATPFSGCWVRPRWVATDLGSAGAGLGVTKAAENGERSFA